MAYRVNIAIKFHTCSINKSVQTDTKNELSVNFFPVGLERRTARGRRRDDRHDTLSRPLRVRQLPGQAGHDPQLALQALHTFIVHYQQAYAKPARAATGGGLAGISDRPAPTRG